MFICDEENQILRFLGSNRKIFFSSSEISRKAGSKKQFLEDPRWASPFLASLVSAGGQNQPAVGESNPAILR